MIDPTKNEIDIRAQNEKQLKKIRHDLVLKVQKLELQK